MRKFDKVRILESRVLYEKHERIVVEDVLEFADGSRHEWIYLKSQGAVAVAAFAEDNKMVLTKQYRHPIRKIIYDLPAGGIHSGETPEHAAQRELEEETGYTADKLEWIGRFNWAPSYMSGMVEIFFTNSLRRIGRFNPHEIVSIELMDFDTVLEKVIKGEFIDSALVIATLLICVKRLLQ